MSHSNLVFRFFSIQLLILGSLFSMPPQGQLFTNFKYKSASVLPIVYFPGENDEFTPFVILGREAGGKNAGTYDDFGGRRDPGEVNPAQTAAREFAEEGLTKQSLGMGKGTMQRYIDPVADNTELVLATKRAVMFITRFSASDIIAFRHKFFEALALQTDPHKREKDVIATVGWGELLHAVKHAQSNSGITVPAMITDPLAGKENGLQRSIITLRPLLVRKLRPLAQGQPFRAGQNAKIWFY